MSRKPVNKDESPAIRTIAARSEDKVEKVRDSKTKMPFWDDLQIDQWEDTDPTRKNEEN